MLIEDEGSVTYRGCFTDSTDEYAVKVPNAHKAMQNNILKECLIMSCLDDCPNIVQVENFEIGNGSLKYIKKTQMPEHDDTSSYICMEMPKYGTLAGLIRSTGGIENEFLLKSLFKQVCRGLDALHTEAGYAHLDLKTENIFIGADL